VIIFWTKKVTKNYGVDKEKSTYNSPFLMIVGLGVGLVITVLGLPFTIPVIFAVAGCALLALIIDKTLRRLEWRRKTKQ